MLLKKLFAIFKKELSAWKIYILARFGLFSLRTINFTVHKISKNTYYSKVNEPY